jgi:IS4 transposase
VGTWLWGQPEGMGVEVGAVWGAGVLGGGAWVASWQVGRDGKDRGASIGAAMTLEQPAAKGR